MSSFFQRNLYLNQGEDYTLTIVLEDEDGMPVTGVGNGTFHIRPHYAANLIYKLDVDFQDSTLYVTGDSAYTRTMKPGRYAYTLEYTTAESVRTRLMDGVLTVRESMSDYEEDTNG